MILMEKVPEIALIILALCLAFIFYITCFIVFFGLVWILVWAFKYSMKCFFEIEIHWNFRDLLEYL